MNRFCNDIGVGLILWVLLCRGYLVWRLDQFGLMDRSKGEKDNQFGVYGIVEFDIIIIKRVIELVDKYEWFVSSFFFCLGMYMMID